MLQHYLKSKPRDGTSTVEKYGVTFLYLHESMIDDLCEWKNFVKSTLKLEMKSSLQVRNNCTHTLMLFVSQPISSCIYKLPTN